MKNILVLSCEYLEKPVEHYTGTGGVSMTDTELIQAFESIVKPLKENIETIKEQLTSIERTEEHSKESIAGLSEHVLEMQQKLNESYHQA